MSRERYMNQKQPYYSNPAESNLRGKKSISTMFDEALKSVNDISDLLPPQTAPSTNPPFQYPFIPYNSGTFPQQMCSPNDMMQMMAQFSQYQQMIQQNQMVPPMVPNQIPITNPNNFTLGPSSQQKPKIPSKQIPQYTKTSEYDERPLPAKSKFDFYEDEKTENKPPTKRNPIDPTYNKPRKPTEVPVIQNKSEGLPIKHTNKTFEQLLEEKLKSNQDQTEPKERIQEKKPVEKKPFLKRKSAMVKATGGKKFAYYADKFNKEEGSEEVKKPIIKKPFASHKNVSSIRPKKLKPQQELQYEHDDHPNNVGRELDIGDTTLGPVKTFEEFASNKVKNEYLNKRYDTQNDNEYNDEENKDIEDDVLIDKVNPIEYDNKEDPIENDKIVNNFVEDNKDNDHLYDDIETRKDEFDKEITPNKLDYEEDKKSNKESPDVNIENINLDGNIEYDVKIDNEISPMKDPNDILCNEPSPEKNLNLDQAYNRNNDQKNSEIETKLKVFFVA